MSSAGTVVAMPRIPEGAITLAKDDVFNIIFFNKVKI
jgi:hypothetical protein